MALGQFSPGPDMLLLTRTALAEGLRSGWMMVAGIVTGLAFHSILAIGGMAILLSQGGLLSTIVKVLAAIYLSWLAFGLLKRGPSGAEGEAPAMRSPYLRGLFCNLLNLKVLVFFAGVVAPFLKEDHPQWWPVALWSVIVSESLILWGLWVWLLQIPAIRRAHRKAGRGLDLVFALGLIFLAFNLFRSAA